MRRPFGPFDQRNKNVNRGQCFIVVDVWTFDLPEGAPQNCRQYSIIPYLADSREEVVGDLVVKRAGQEGDELAVVGVVHARLDLTQLSVSRGGEKMGKESER